MLCYLVTEPQVHQRVKQVPSIGDGSCWASVHPSRSREDKEGGETQLPGCLGTTGMCCSLCHSLSSCWHGELPLYAEADN